MNFDPSLISTPLFIAALVVCLSCLTLAIYHAPLRALAAVPARQHSYFGCILLLPLFWSLNVKMQGTIDIHLLGVTALVLVFGWSLAVLALSVAALAHHAVGSPAMWSLPLDLLVSGLLPACVSYGVFRLVNRIRVPNLFIYMLGAGFFGAVCSVLAIALAAWVMSLYSGDALFRQTLSQALPFLLLWAFPEGFVNGTLVSALTVFYPDLVKTFDDQRYLAERAASRKR